MEDLVRIGSTVERVRFVGLAWLSWGYFQATEFAEVRLQGFVGSVKVTELVRASGKLSFPIPMKFGRDR